ncbi:hypothetical protein [Aurantimonas sp. VKM B-3413]|uniref:hypothetical protein n=1 Tax=Aurantimonas sp. VKM B-3413 TaxID=2779401 RepID=UPI001E59DDD4|nr:hypothetical protein [Aurantimonas sp. VKM B-3413]MCB8838501.1 hypothetical protein [Aurantimonas sp. VKM B-3413]
MSDPAFIGALVGLIVGIADFVLIGYLRQRIAREKPSERLGAGVALNVARFSQLIFFPVVGWFVGPIVAAS